MLGDSQKLNGDQNLLGWDKHPFTRLGFDPISNGQECPLVTWFVFRPYWSQKCVLHSDAVTSNSGQYDYL